MSGARQVFLGFFMALLFSAIVLGSLSLSLIEGGYVLAQAPTPGFGEMVFKQSDPIIKLAEGEEIEQNSPELPVESVVILAPTPTPCVHPAGWNRIVAQPEHTLRYLAHQYDSNIKAIMTGNCMLGETVVIGSELYVPPALPRTSTPLPTYRPPVYWTPVPTYPRWPTPTPTLWIPTSTPVTPPPTQPPPTPLPTAQPTPPTPYPTAPPTQPLPTAQPTPPTEPVPTQPAPTDPVPTDLPPTLPPPPTPVPPTPQPQPTSQPPPTAQQPPPQPTLPPPEPTSPPPQEATLPVPN